MKCEEGFYFSFPSISSQQYQCDDSKYYYLLEPKEYQPISNDYFIGIIIITIIIIQSIIL